MRNAKRLLPFLAVRLAGLTCGVVAAAGVMAVLGMFSGDVPLGIALGAALGFGRLCMTARLFSQAMAAQRGKTALAVACQLAGLAFLAAVLVFCIKRSVWLFAGGALGLLLTPVVIVMNHKKIGTIQPFLLPCGEAAKGHGRSSVLPMETPRRGGSV